MDGSPDDATTDAPAAADARETGDGDALPAHGPFAPQPTLAIDHPPPINVEVGSGAHGLPARPTRVQGSLEAGGLRVVIIAWCFWLLGSWGAAWLADTGLPRVRWMLFAGLLGMMLVWPALRLSQPVHVREPGRGGAQAFLDWLAMVLVFQAVIWSLRLIAGWTIMRGYWLDAAFISWTLLTALVVAWGRTSASGWVRTFAFGVCLGIVLAEPLSLVVFGVPGPEAMRVSPLQTVWALTHLPANASLSPWDGRIIVVGVSAVLGWAVLAGWGWLARSPRQPEINLEDDPYGQRVEVIDIAAGQREREPSATIQRPPDGA
ncbi:hypothetical protein OT109_08625 [Phycisphaeraceae bacterium D3-23]